MKQNRIQDFLLNFLPFIFSSTDHKLSYLIIINKIYMSFLIYLYEAYFKSLV